ncbi:hypothetical protein CI109_105807 [Kwoniella shandongensis]|uniref:Uncharacterized protein n=1 Tax=Kwoniella shandongensis TaxID=1734106 RepID=A0A5M6C0V6_9TREE|nr:uncharacterized protein CI109_003146 [Kwoniella shandongensis]KAA5528614.1 hypothetical protein CI109_003146 [Kwoniella shandongensis]
MSDLSESPSPSTSQLLSSEVTSCSSYKGGLGQGGENTASRSTTPSMHLSPMTFPQSQSSLLRAPSEIIQRVLVLSGSQCITTVARMARSCRDLKQYVYGDSDQALWRDIHDMIYDNPRVAGTYPDQRKTDEIDWRKKIQDREFVGRMFREWDEDKFPEVARHLDLVLETLLDMYLDLPASVSYENSDPHATHDSRNVHFLNSYLRTPLFAYIYHHLRLAETKQVLRPLPGQVGNPNRRTDRRVMNPILSRLHCLMPPEYDDATVEDREWRGYVREVVYNGKNFQERNDWGPFREDGKVDWTLVDAISSVMMSNAKEVLESEDDGSWREAIHPMSFGVEAVRGWGYEHLQRPADLPEGEVWDWAGVQGLWCGSYAFLDYADWVSLNEPRLILLRGRITSLDLTRYHEAVGDLMRLNLVVDKQPTTTPTATTSSSDTSTSTSTSSGSTKLRPIETALPTLDLLPPIHFHGDSVQHHGASTYPLQTPMSFVRGVVRLTADNPPQVRWTLVIRYGNEDRWRLECVQVGGRGSKRGFFGIWTDALKEEHSPNGPIWYWKA